MRLISDEECLLYLLFDLLVFWVSGHCRRFSLDRAPHVRSITGSNYLLSN